MTTLIALQMLLMTAAAPDAVAPIAMSAPTQAICGPESEWSPLDSQSFGGGNLCFCVCAAPIHELQDVETSGSCQALVGQFCQGSSGPGVYTFCITG